MVSEVRLVLFLISALHEDECPSWRAGRFIPDSKFSNVGSWLFSFDLPCHEIYKNFSSTFFYIIDRNCSLLRCASRLERVYWVIGRLNNGKAILVTGLLSPWGCETSRLRHSLDNQLIGDGEVVSLTRRPPFTSRCFCNCEGYKA
jgi:hypothetical protein